MPALRFAALVAVFVIPLAGLALIGTSLEPESTASLSAADLASSRQSAPGGVALR